MPEKKILKPNPKQGMVKMPETKILKLNSKNEKEILKIAVEFLKKGKTIIYPTETCYGIGAKISSKKGIEKIFKAKQRNPKKALSIIVSDKKMVEKYAVLNEKAVLLMEKFMPGPLTLVVEKKKNVPNVLSKRGIAFRISGNTFATKICKMLGEPIASTSANIEGEKEIYDEKELLEKFSKKVDLILLAGNLSKNKTSTIFDVENGKVLREGNITEKEIKKKLKSI